MKSIPVIIIIMLWEMAASMLENIAFMVGKPSYIAIHLWAELLNTRLIYDIAITGAEAVAGLLLALITTIPLGVLLSQSARIRWFFGPWIALIGLLPVVALGPMLIFWFGTGILSKIAIVWLITSPLIITSVQRGTIKAQSDYHVLAHVYGATRVTEFRHLLLPSALYSVFSILPAHINAALLGAIIGEFLSSQAGLGHRIIVAEGLYNMNGIWVGIVGILALAYCLHQVILKSSTLYLKKEFSEPSKQLPIRSVSYNLS